jgi:DNA-binding LytR/AlgR family response regulator
METSMAKFIEVMTLQDEYVLLNIDQITSIRNHGKFVWILTNNEEIIETMHTYGELKAIFDKVLEPRCKAVMVDSFKE